MAELIAFWQAKNGTPIPLNYLKLWLRADYGIIKDVSNYITRWEDQSGNGNHLVQNSGNLQPLWIESDPYANGKPSVYFDSDFMLGSIISGINTSSLSVFLSVRSDNVTGESVIFSINDANYWIDKDTYGRLAIMNSITNAYSSDYSIFPNPTKYKVISDIKTINVSHKTYVDGIEKISKSGAGYTGSFTNGAIKLGNRNATGDRPLKGYVKDVIVYGTDLSESDRQTVENYLKIN
jgi:hypothetical protein